MPRVSVVVPYYNGEAWIAATLGSLQRQSFRDFEALIVDDGSQRDPAQVLAPFLTDPRFRYERKDHGGIPQTRNHALSLAKGDLIAFLDQDDLWSPQKLALQVAILDADRSSDVVYSPVEIIDAAGRRTSTWPPWWWWRGAEGMIFDKLVKRWTVILLLSVLVRRSALDAAGRFDERLYGLDDIDMVLRLAEIVKFARIHRPLASWRWHAGSGGTSEKMYQDQFAVLDKLKRLWPAHAAAFAKHERTAHLAYGQFLRHSGRRPEAKAQFAEAWRRNRLDPVAALLTLFS